MITISVSNTLDSFNYLTYFKAYHQGAGTGGPVFVGGDGFGGDAIELHYQDAAKIVRLGGEDFRYTLSNHYLSGDLHDVAYTKDGVSEVSISGLDIRTPVGMNEPLGPLVYALMGDDPSGGGARDGSPNLLVRTFASEAQHFVGGLGNDSYVGTKFDDIIEGNAGRDVLSGAQGRDTFVFDTKSSPANLDRITDFSVANDTIELENAVFKKLGAPGVLKATAFFDGPHAHDANDRVVYNEKTGGLFYDADGSGAIGAVQIASLKPHLAITAKDFLIA